MKQSSPDTSSLASNVLKRKQRPGLGGHTLDRERRYVPVEDFNALLADAKSLAGSVLSQDETSDA